MKLSSLKILSHMIFSSSKQMIVNFVLMPFMLLTSFLQLQAQQQDTLSTFLLEPSGKYAIGIRSLILVDSSRNEHYSRKTEFREVRVKIFYPVEISPEDIKYDKYLDKYPLEVIYDIFNSVGIDEKFIEMLQEMHTYSSSSLEISDTSQKFPVIIFNPGYFFGMTGFYTSIIEHLVSNGYIVCSINHPYEQPYVELSDGVAYLHKKRAFLTYLQWYISDFLQIRRKSSERRIERITRYFLKNLYLFDQVSDRWTEDSDFFIDYMTDMSKEKTGINVFAIMDINAVGSLGHSIGGAVAGKLCSRNPIVKAGINMDCFQFGNIIDNPLDVPLMLMQSEQFPDWNLGNTAIYKNSKSDFYRLTFKNGRHFIFSDAALFSRLMDQEDANQLIGNINGFYAGNIIKKYILEFFNENLLNIPSKILPKEVDNQLLIFEKVN